jgi:hypothetical protein
MCELCNLFTRLCNTYIDNRFIFKRRSFYANSEAENCMLKEQA